MSKTKNIDRVSPYFEACVNDAVLVTLEVNEKRSVQYLKITPLVVKFTDGYIEINEETGKFVIKKENIKKISQYGIEKLEIGLIQTPSGGGAVSYLSMMRTLVRLEIFSKYNESEVWVCDALSLVPEIFKWLQSHQIIWEDSFGLEEIFEEDHENTLLYIKENFKQLLAQARNKEKYQEVYVPYRETKRKTVDED